MHEAVKSLVLVTLVILVVGMLSLSYLGGYWIHSQNQANTNQNSQPSKIDNSMQDSNQYPSEQEIQDLFAKLRAWMHQKQATDQNSQSQQGQQIALPQLSPSPPSTTISNDTIYWSFHDSLGNPYRWSMPMSMYDFMVKQNVNIGTYNLQLQNGQMIQTYDYRQFAKTVLSSHDLSHVTDQIYDNAGNDAQFIHEVWYIVSEMTTYSQDNTNSNLWPLEALTRGEGDCKDKAILIADMLRSSTHTANWKINLALMDSDNPDNPQKANHMIVMVDTGSEQYNIDGTVLPTGNGVNYWGHVVYWPIPV